MQYFKFLSLLFKAMGYEGWVILFDEAELIQRHGPKGRIKAYSVLNHLMSMNERFDFPMVTVFAFASTFEQFMVEKDEIRNLKDKIELKDQELSEKIGKTMEKLLRIPSLPELKSSDYRNIVEGVIQLHAQAFDWTPKANIEELIRSITVERRVRTLIRGVIQKLDLLYLDRPSEITIGEIDESILSEYDDFFTESCNDDIQDIENERICDYTEV
jgi:hypothetical protein